jgi:hypothetical protein
MRKLHISFEQREIVAPGDATVQADLLVTGGSWDPRSVGIIDLPILATNSLVLKYANNADGVGERHGAQIKEWSAANGSSVVSLEFSSENVQQDFAKVWEEIRSLFVSEQRSLRILVDLAVVPRYVSLGILSRGFLSGCVAEVSYLYQTAAYPARLNTDETQVSLVPLSARDLDEGPPLESTQSPAIFTEGRWRTVFVPGLRGDYWPGRRRHYYIALGFEGDDTYRVVQQREPDQVTVVVPDPPVSPGLENRSLTENEVLIREWVGERAIRRCGALDAVAMDRMATGFSELTENAYFLPVGTKPHALGMAVAALRTGGPMVLYRWPEKHRDGHTLAGDRRVLYTARDLTALV